MACLLTRGGYSYDQSKHLFREARRFSARGKGTYPKRHIQQLVRQTSKAAGISKRVYPHLLRHTVAQHLADRGMPENLLQQFLGHAKLQTTQFYYEPRRKQVKDAHREAMTFSS